VTDTLRIGLSTCPNDTFLFAPLLPALSDEAGIDRRGLELELVLADVQQLNEALLAASLDVSKASFATALELSDRYGVLRVGSALGFGTGPILLARPDLRGAPRRILCPGRGTTATLLLGTLHPELPAPRHVRFDAIIPALRAGEADAGVCIHEARFTYPGTGLVLREDLGRSWEERTGLPVPLGGLLARLALGADVHARLAGVLGDALAWSRAHPERTLGTMRAHARELDDEVIRRHVELYVNEHTTDLGGTGARCLAELAARCGAGAAPAIVG